LAGAGQCAGFLLTKVFATLQGPKNPAHIASDLSMRTFREIYCEQHGLAPAKFERVLVGRCLYLQARAVYWVLLILPGDYLQPDFDFARGVGDLRSRRGYHTEAAEYRAHPKNRGFFRSVLRLRVSTLRLQAIFERAVTATNSTPPV
jgi:hypothetical protein